MADSTQQRLWTEEVELLLESTPQFAGDLEHQIWAWQSRIELLRNLAAHALTGGQPLVAASIYQQIGDLEERVLLLRNNLEAIGG